MEDSDLQNLDNMDTEKTSQDVKNESNEISALLKDEVKAENPDITFSPEKNPTDAQVEETIKLISDIEQQVKPAGKDFDSMQREQLVAFLEETVKADDVNNMKTDVALIKVAFLKKNKLHSEGLLQKFIDNGGKKEDYCVVSDELTDCFNAAFEIYKDKKARFTEELEKQKQENLKIKLQILDELKQLVDSDEELKRTYDAFKTLQERWKEIGLVPKTEINNLWQNYNFLVEKFFDKVKINKELKDLDLKKNLEAKMDLCEKTEELLLETSIVRSIRQLQKYHDMWRDIGPVSQDKKDEIWYRFRNATEKLNERRREYYSKLQEDQEKNTETKTVLCEKAEQIAEMTLNNAREWQDQTAVLNDMLNAWKTIGPAPKKVNDEIWERFKTAVDNFFNNKKEFFGKLKDDQIDNYNQKLNLCVQAEAVKGSNEWKRATEELIRLQHEWKKIGPVPKKYSDKIWKRFRTACDEFFSNKSLYFSSIDSKEEENFKLKNELLAQLKDYRFGDDDSENLKIIKEFQRKWMEIGHVPVKYKNDLHREFRDAVNQHLDKLKINPVEKGTIGFKSKFENIAQSAGANQIIYKEKSFIINRISTIKNDIKLWENNIGFFANSKKANLLKEEFLEKIEKAKQDIKILEEKLKFLKEVK
ncbi:MAG: DUF349 domain-containing protein [Bacteroidota bacterium]